MAKQKPSRPSRPQKAKTEGFWDKPGLMNPLADFLFLCAGLALAWALVTSVQRLPIFPLRQVVVQGALKQVTRTQIEFAARSSVSGNFFTVDLDGVRGAFEKLPWVRRAEVRRLWPDGLELTIEEHQAAARWRRGDGEARLVNTFGEVFAAASEAELPVFTGLEGTASRMLERHRAFETALAPLGLHVRTLTLSPRESWELKLDDGLVLALGREEPKHPVDERLNRFVGSYAVVKEKTRVRATQIDMRYPNGFALRAAHPEKTS